MPTKRDVPCAGCGELLWRGPGSLPPGQATCLKCRSAANGPFQGRCGTVGKYRRGCRCAECRAAKTESFTRYIANRRRQQGLPEVTYAPCAGCGVTTSARQGRCVACAPRREVRISRKRRLAIYERDSWTCGFCLEPVDRGAPANSDWQAVLDHITPRSQGGRDVEENLRTLHRYCNNVRYTKAALTIEELVS